jgi:hypothetical protein
VNQLPGRLEEWKPHPSLPMLPRQAWS